MKSSMLQSKNYQFNDNSKSSYLQQSKKQTQTTMYLFEPNKKIILIVVQHLQTNFKCMKTLINVLFFKTFNLIC